MPKHAIVLFASCDKSRKLAIRFTHHISRDEYRGEYEAHYSHATSPPAVQAECVGKQLALVAVTGTKKEAEIGFGILKEALGRKCQVAMLIDKSGYEVCLENRGFDFSRVKFLVKLGPGPFDPSIAECFAARNSRSIRICAEDWVSGSIVELVRRASDQARSISTLARV